MVVSLETLVELAAGNQTARSIAQENNNRAKQRKSAVNDIAAILGVDPSLVDLDNPATYSELNDALKRNSELARANYLVGQETYLAADDDKIAGIALFVEPKKVDGVEIHNKHYDAHDKFRKVQADLNSEGEKYDENVKKYSREYIKSEIENAKSSAVAKMEDQIEKMKREEAYQHLTKDHEDKMKKCAALLAEAAANRELAKSGALDDPRVASALYLNKLQKKFTDSFEGDNKTHDIANYTRTNIRAHAESGDEGIDKAIAYVSLLAEKKKK